MSKKLFGLLFFLVLFGIKGASAQELEKRLNAERDRIYYMLEKSEKIKLPDSVFTQLKRYAAVNNIHESLVMKSSFYLNILYNPELTADDKLAACKFAFKIFNGEPPILPLSIFLSAMKELEKNTPQQQPK